MAQSTRAASQRKGSAQSQPDADPIYANGINNDTPINGLAGASVQTLTDDVGSLDGVAISLDRYWSEIYQQTARVYEWNNGILEEKPMADVLKFEMYVWFLMLLKDYLSVNPIAKMIGQELGFTLNLTSGTKVRAPDLGIVRHNNPIPLADRDRTYDGI